MTKIDGNLIKEHVKNECKPFKEQLEGKEISIVRFGHPEDIDKQKVAMYKAALVSENQKVKTFEAIGVTVNRVTLIPEETSVEEFQQVIESINQDDNIKAAIVQYPVPDEFKESVKLLAPEKDIDCVRYQPNDLCSSPATAEGVARIVESYAEPNSNVAIIGGGGFIGSGVRNYLEENNINSFVLEVKDDKSRTSEADIVVTVTGVAGESTPYILPQHRLVVDSGFTPGENEGDLPRGDVDRSAYDIPEIITPVPGGIGPTEMAILAERFVKMELGIELPKWKYQDLAQKQEERANEVTPIAKKLEDENVKAAIVQFPVPPEFTSTVKLLAPQKDIDCVRKEPNELFSSPATAEGVARIVESYAEPDSNVAIIGGRGFIGRGVREYLDENNISSFVLEIEDDKTRTSEADIVVTVTGVAGESTPYILPQHRLVVDSGFTPGENEGDLPRGDVDRSAYDIPEIITPVPGGIGPTEMAILAERFVKMELGVELPKWKYQDLAQEQEEKAAEITPVAKKLLSELENYSLTGELGDITPQSRQMFNSLKDNFSQEESKTSLIGDKYKVVLNTERETFSISRTEEKTLLVRKNLRNNQIEVNRGLTNDDIQQWKNIDRLLPKDNEQREINPPQNKKDIEQ